MFNEIYNIENNSTILELKGLGKYKVVLDNRHRLQLYKYTSDLYTNDFEYVGLFVMDNNITSYALNVLDGTNIVLVYTTLNGLSKVAIWPGDFPLYGNNDPYRFYYGVDSETLYMNVQNRWLPVAYLSHDKMHDVGTMTHDQLESTIVGALERISNLETALASAVSTVDYLNSALDSAIARIEALEGASTDTPSV